MKKTVLLGVSAGIAGYKLLEVLHFLRAADYEVFVIMTDHAQQMFPTADFAAAAGHPVLTTLFEDNFDYTTVLKTRHVQHIDLSEQADLLVIAPATANIIAKLAYGIADDLLTTIALAVTAPILVCPSMNEQMWFNPIVQKNVRELKTRGMHVLEPESGKLACGVEGVGRLAGIDRINSAILELLGNV